MKNNNRPTDLAVLQIKWMLKAGFLIEEIAAYFSASEKDIKYIIKKYLK